MLKGLMKTLPKVLPVVCSAVHQLARCIPDLAKDLHTQVTAIYVLTFYTFAGISSSSDKHSVKEHGIKGSHPFWKLKYYDETKVRKCLHCKEDHKASRHQ